MKIKTKLGLISGFLLRMIIGALALTCTLAITLLGFWIIETLGSQVIIGGIFLIVFIVVCYSVGCSIYPNKERGENDHLA